MSVSSQELLYGSKEAGVGTSSQIFDSNNEILPSSKEILGSRKDTRAYERLDTNVFQRTSLKDKSLIKNPKNVIRGSEKVVVQKEGQQPCGSSINLHKCQKKAINPQRPTLP
ncbi:hypothetical protein O181_044660 [Austropuccinia psidii MF-1]|uniref:Uncharacterized protein n=1 Tax=Austropuccinia psidii MF-1 TaxID=1389203 RepID=A0A9Q3DKG4_9BASI|nr:hypothetical protein [Austropuccinia psidii MF-1]